jgi:hypothetical protein
MSSGILDKYIDNILKNKDDEILKDRLLLLFFEKFNSSPKKEQLFKLVFNIDKTIPSSSANGFISFISFKKDPSFKFVLKTPKSGSGDDPYVEYIISRELTKKVIKNKNKIPQCVAKTWGHLYCVPDYKDKGTPMERLNDNNACLNDFLSKPRTHIIMEYIPGETYADIIKSQKISFKEILKILCIILCNLHVLRKETGFTHYDLHYGNIMIQKLDKTMLYKFNHNGNLIEIPIDYKPVFIDFGRTYIDLPKNLKMEIKRQVFMYSEDNFDLIKQRFYTTLIKPLSYERDLISAFKDILEQYVSLKNSKNSCIEYSIKEQTIILATSIIIDFIEKTKKVSELDFYIYLRNEYYPDGICRMDISSDRGNNVCDFLKISMLIFEVMLSKKNSIGLAIQPVFNRLFLNFPYILPGQNFLPYHKIKYPKKTTGIFCLNDEIDLINVMSEYGLIDKKFIKKIKVENKESKKYSLFQIFKPVNKNLFYVSDFLVKQYTKNPMNLDSRSLYVSPVDNKMSMSVQKQSQKSQKLQKGVVGIKRIRGVGNIALLASPEDKRKRSSSGLSGIQQKIKKLQI